MVALWNRADHYIFMLWFVLSSSSFFAMLSACVHLWLAVLCGQSAWRHADGTEKDVHVSVGERAQGVQPAELLQSVHDGPSAAEHWRAEGHDRVLHRSHNEAGRNGTRAGSLLSSCLSRLCVPAHGGLT